MTLLVNKPHQAECLEPGPLFVSGNVSQGSLSWNQVLPWLKGVLSIQELLAA